MKFFAFAHIFILYFLMFASFEVNGQGRVLGYPVNYIRPVNPYVEGSGSAFVSKEVQSLKKDNRAWWVTVDRANVKVYQQSKGEWLNGKSDFGETYFVKEIKNGRAYLVKATVDRLKIKNLKKEVGWVNVDDLLLWNEGLIDRRTQINLRAFLLNSRDNIGDIPCEEVEGNLVSVYKSPTGRSKKNVVKAFETYFVYKIEGARYLLGKLPNLSSYEEDAGLLGWVDMGRVAEWNTRVALEPNFTQEAYKERKADSALQVIGYRTAPEALEALENGNNTENAYFARDPVNAEPYELSKEDSKRWKGHIMRFPILAEALPGVFKCLVTDSISVMLRCGNGTIKRKYAVNDVAYFPERLRNAKYDLFSYVLFWPENDLRNYYSFLENNMPQFSNMRNYKDKREGLKNVYCKMLDEFTGGDLKKNCLDYSIGEVNRISQGVRAEGVKFKFEDIKIGDLLDNRIIPNDKIDTLISRQVKSKNNLRKIIQGEFGEFYFQRSTEKFFWIKVDDVF